MLDIDNGKDRVIMPVQVHTIGVDSIKVNGGIHAELKDFHPVKLTEELLVKAGFEKYVIPAGKDTLTGKPYEEEVKWIREEINYEDIFKQSWTELKYVHQLQNLYYALTGEELKINLKATSEKEGQST